MLPLHSLATLFLASASAFALSSHSPRDLEAHPAYSVVLSEQYLLNETVSGLLTEDLEVRSLSLHPSSKQTQPPHADSSSRFLAKTTPVADRQRPGLSMYRTIGQRCFKEAGGGSGGSRCARSGGGEGARGAARLSATETDAAGMLVS
jgi:hypothetical protein